jgi:hypothetical protein
MARIDLVGAIFRSLTSWFRRIHHETTDEAVASPELVLGDLMAQRARDAVGGEPVPVLAGVERQMSEDPPFMACHLGLKASHGHVTDAALVLNRRAGLGMIDGFTSHSGLPVRITAGIGHHRRTPIESD